jgi:hypothetical protein
MPIRNLHHRLILKVAALLVVVVCDYVELVLVKRTSRKSDDKGRGDRIGTRTLQKPRLR